jgi:V8-like Glu-specific endopeptidase
VAVLPQPDHAQAGDASRLGLPATVFGIDDRVQVTETRRPGFRSLTLLVGSTSSGEDYSCSGAFLDFNVILTAAHCLWVNGSWANNIRVIPAANGASAPFGGAYASSLSIPTGYPRFVGSTPGEISADAIAFDFGLVFLKDSPFGMSLAPYLPLVTLADDYFVQSDLSIGTAGYPADKPHGTMWYARTSLATMDSRLLYTLLDEAPGQSGSPIFTVDKRTGEPGDLISIVTEATAPNNRSVRITDAVIAILQQYCASLGCRFAVAPSPLMGPPDALVTGPVSAIAEEAGCLPMGGPSEVTCPAGGISLLTSPATRATIEAVRWDPGSVDLVLPPRVAPERMLVTRKSLQGGPIEEPPGGLPT